MRIGIDLDGPVYDFVASLADFINWATSRPFSELGPATKWDFYKDWGYTFEEYTQFVKYGVELGTVFGSGMPKSGARGAIRTLHAAGHTIHIVTNRAISPRAQELTVRWLAKWEIPYDSLTFSNDKTIVHTDYFIDDLPANVDALRAVGVQAFLLDCGYKEQVGHPHLISSWGDFLREVGREDQ